MEQTRGGRSGYFIRIREVLTEKVTLQQRPDRTEDLCTHTSAHPPLHTHLCTSTLCSHTHPFQRARLRTALAWQRPTTGARGLGTTRDLQPEKEDLGTKASDRTRGSCSQGLVVRRVKGQTQIQSRGW